MGFRNPVTSLPADKITPGVLGPGVLASAFSPTAYGRRIDLVDPAAPTASATF